MNLSGKKLKDLPESLQNLALFGAAVYFTFVDDEAAERDLSETAIELTVLFILLAVVFFPIGVKYILGINKTDIGIEAGSNTETIVDNIVPIALVVVIMGLVNLFKKKGK